MSSRMHGSEDPLALFACAEREPSRHRAVSSADSVWASRCAPLLICCHPTQQSSSLSLRPPCWTGIGVRLAARRPPASRQARDGRGQKRGGHAAFETPPVRLRAAGRGQWAFRINCLRQRQPLRPARARHRASGAQTRRRVRGVVVTRGSTVRATPSPCRLRRHRGTRPRAPEERRPEAHHLPWRCAPFIRPRPLTKHANTPRSRCSSRDVRSAAVAARRRRLLVYYSFDDRMG